MGSDPAPMTPQVGAFIPLPEIPKGRRPGWEAELADRDRLALRMKKHKEAIPESQEVMIVLDWREFLAIGTDGQGNPVTKEQMIKRLENRMGWWVNRYPGYKFFRRGVVVYGRYEGPIAG